MKTSFAIAAFVTAGAGAAGVGAFTMIGAQNLTQLTMDLISTTSLSGSPLCPGATAITFSGAGSGVAEAAMLAGTQVVAPMLRMLGTAVCKGIQDAGVPTTASAIVIGLDGLSLISATSQGGTAACNGSAGGSTATQCSVDAGVPIDTTVGLAINSTLTLPGGTTYTYTDWRDVLRILYFGKDHSGTINCNSTIRNYLVSNWSSIFQNAGCSSGTCTQIQHLFRRDDSAATADLFAETLGFAAVNAASGAAVSSLVATAIGATYSMGADTYCNSTINAGTSFNVTQPGINQGQENHNTLPIVVNDDQDSDPIRRPCAYNARTGAEYACSTYLDPINTCSSTVACPSGETCIGTDCWDNSLGLVLPILNASSLGALQYDVQPCTQTITVNAPLVASTRSALPNGLCPNGDTSLLNSACYVPADASGNPNCLATNSQLTPPLSNETSQGGTGRGPSPQSIDPRVFNKWIWNGVNIAKDDTSRPIYGGAFYRIHSQTPTLGGAGSAACLDPTGDDQTACLAVASPCSLGFGGKEAVANTNGAATALKINGIPPVSACIQAMGTPGEYKFSRKLYFATVAGFGAASAPELALATCEATTATINTGLAFEKFVTLPTTGPNAVNGGNPFCEDFNEHLLCSAASNANGCALNANVGLPTVSTTCGNGVVEAFEECDPAAPTSTWNCNQTSGTCSTTCHCN